MQHAGCRLRASDVFRGTCKGLLAPNSVPIATALLERKLQHSWPHGICFAEDLAYAGLLGR